MNTGSPGHEAHVPSYAEETTVMLLNNNLALTEDRPTTLRSNVPHSSSPVVTAAHLDIPDSRPFTAVHLIPRTDWNTITEAAPSDPR